MIQRSRYPILLCALWACGQAAGAQNAPATPRLTDGANPFNVGGMGQDTGLRSTPQNPGTPFAEILRGNGSRVGYVLTHGAVLVDTFRLQVAGRSLRMGQDFWLDSYNGTLFFAQSVRSSDSINVYYRYLEGKDTQRQPLGLPGIQFGLGKNSRLNLHYGMTPGNGTGLDITTYGLGLNAKLGGQSSLTGLLYFSNAAANNNLILPTRASNLAPTAPQGETGVGQLIVQNLQLKTGGFQLTADYQDVGAKFNGFQALRQSNANNAALVNQLNQLEAEKGIQRMGLGLQAFGKTGVPGASGLALQWSQIGDGKDTIQQQVAEFGSQSFRFRYAEREVGANFTQFQGLREADKAQWMREKGLKTTQLGMGLTFGGGKKGTLPGVLEFAEMRFADKSGSLDRQLWSLRTGNLGLQMLSRTSDKGFGRLNDLSDADKTALALDLYQQYDPKATAAQVTANDKAQVTREAGLDRQALRADAALGKGRSLSFGQARVGDKDGKESKGGMQRTAVNLQTPKVGLNLTNRRTDANFNRVGDLSDVEKTYIALDIRRQFEPDATPDQITPKEREQAIRETGLSRSALRGRFDLSRKKRPATLTFQQFQIADTTGKETDNLASIQRYVLNYQAPHLQLSYLNQAISDNFTRLAGLSDIERTQFGNEHGLQRQQWAAVWQVSKITKLAVNGLRISGTPDVARAAAAQAQQQKKDPSSAARSAVNGVTRQNLTFETKGLSLSANMADTAKTFARTGDLAASDAERRQIEQERGFVRTDYTLKAALLKGRLNLDSTAYSARNAGDNLGRETYRHNLTYLPLKGLSLAFLADADLATADSKVNGMEHSLLTVARDFGKGFQFNAFQEETATYQQGDKVAGAKTEFVQFDTPQNKPTTLRMQSRRIAYHKGKFENTFALNAHAKPTKEFSFNYAKLEIDRGGGEGGEKAPDETTDSFDFQWQATKQFSVLAGVSQRETNNDADGNAVSIGLQGEPVKNLSLTAKFDEVHNDGKNTHDVADFAISNAKPISLGPLTDLTITARYSSLNDQRKLQNETMTGRLAWKLWKNEFILDYGGYTQKDGLSTVARIYSFATDPNPKKWLHAGFFYKVRTLQDGQERLIRRFTADARLSKNTNFVYTYGTLPEDDKGNIQPITTADVALRHLLHRGKTLLFYYRLSDSAITKVLTRSLGLGFEGKLSNTSKFLFAWSLDTNGFADRYDRSQHFHFAYDHQITPDHIFSLSTEIRGHDAKGLMDEIQANLEYRLRF